ncbi:MAG: hypothetical protein K0S74_217 [Chlamydiales bacterium]|jgi:hypothetical protein|nr:hypothetical protein [Chlamydiales bacterium]
MLFLEIYFFNRVLNLNAGTEKAYTSANEQERKVWRSSASNVNKALS